MESLSPNKVVNNQREFYYTNQSKDIKFRILQLKKLKTLLKANEEILKKALFEDFKKPHEETYINELSQLYHAINLCIQELPFWAEKKSVSTNLANLPGHSYIVPEPLGVTLTIGSWNYPYMVTLHPVIYAMAAGNTVVIKPSELAPHSSKAMAQIINENFDSNYMCVIQGGVEITTDVLNQRFDKIFYTGGSNVGRIIMKAAAEHLTPVTLELGGKSPCIICADANLKVAAKRTVWAKFMNNGQTCTAPDYIYIDEKVRDQFIPLLQQEIVNVYGENPANSDIYSRIINQRHFKRLTQLIDESKVIHGGNYDEEELYIAPTIMSGVSFNDTVMQEEIFGPILPIVSFQNIEEAIDNLKRKESPLALYLYTGSKKIEKRIVKELPFGSGVVNDAIVQMSNTDLPFGGIGNSGMGSYHGKFGFDDFSHYKPILSKATWIDPPIRYAPYSNWKMKLLKWILE